MTKRELMSMLTIGLLIVLFVLPWYIDVNKDVEPENGDSEDTYCEKQLELCRNSELEHYCPDVSFSAFASLCFGILITVVLFVWVIPWYKRVLGYSDKKLKKRRR